MLILFPAVGSGTVLILLPTPELTTLVGLPGLFATPFAGLATGGGACSITDMAAGRKNIPLPIGQSKYLWPCTLPSFFPVLSPSSTPTHSPAAKCGSPIYLIIPIWPLASSTVWPMARSLMMCESSGGYTSVSTVYYCTVEEQLECVEGVEGVVCCCWLVLMIFVAIVNRRRANTEGFVSIS